MVTSRDNNDAIDRLIELGSQAGPCRDVWMYSKIERGAIEAVRRDGHYLAARLMAQAKVPVRAALRLIRIAYANGAAYRDPGSKLRCA
jgi:hypothetical protein